MSKKLSKRLVAMLLLVMFVAIGLRAVSASQAEPPTKDNLEYDTLARNLADGRGFANSRGEATAFRPPGYPLFLASIYKLSSGSRAAARVVECLVGGLTCLLLFMVTREALSPQAGLLAAGLWAINPLALDSYFAVGTLNSETLTSFLLLGALYAIWKSIVVLRTKWAVLAGLALGIAIVAKSSLLPLPLFLLPVWLIRVLQVRSFRPIYMGAITAIVCCFCILPWTYRNYRALGEFIPLSTNGGITFYRSNNIISDGGHNYPEGQLNRYKELSEVERSKRFYEDGRSYVRSHKDRVPWLVYRKVRLLLEPYYPSRMRGGIATINAWYLFVGCLAVLGLIAAWRKNLLWNWLGILTFMQLFFVTALFHGYSRFRFPYESLLAIWAAGGVLWLGGRFRKTHQDASVN